MIQKCISFSLYGNDPKYTVGAYKNIQIINDIMPEWTIKIYTNDRVTSDITVQRLSKCKNTIIIDPESLELGDSLLNARMFWRYLSFFDDYPCIVRDLDSRITHREKKYIDNWIISDNNFFIIRDHPWHAQVPGGLIGMKNSGHLFRDFFIKFVSNKDTGWGKDQEMLNDFIYSNPQNIKHIYKCEYNSQNYLPRDDKNFFIGIQLDENDKPICQQSLQYLVDLNL